eukprot:352958-Chlamydomonas_euryale.AAC.6
MVSAYTPPSSCTSCSASSHAPAHRNSATQWPRDGPGSTVGGNSKYKARDGVPGWVCVGE